MLCHSHSIMNYRDKNSQIFIKKWCVFESGQCVSLFLVLFHCKYWRTLPAPFYRRGIKCSSTSNTWTTEQGWHVNIEWVLLDHFSHPMLIFGTIHLFPPECSSPVPCDMQPTKNRTTLTREQLWTLENFSSPASSCGHPLPTDCLHKLFVRAKPLQQTDAQGFDLSHTQKSFLPDFAPTLDWDFCFGDRNPCYYFCAAPSIVRREQFSVLRSRESRDCLFWPGVRFLPV